MGPHLTLRDEPPGVSQVVAESFGFLSSCDRDVREPLMLPQGSEASFQVEVGNSESSPVVTGILGFLLSLNRGIRLHLLRPETLLSF